MYLQWQRHLLTGEEPLDVDLRDVTIAQLDSGTYLYASTGVNGGLTAYTLGAGGTATLIDQQYFDDQTGPVASGVVEVVQIGGQTQLIFGSTGQNSLVSYTLLDGGRIGSLSEIGGVQGATAQIGAVLVNINPAV